MEITPVPRLFAVNIATHQPETLIEFYQRAFHLTPPKWRGKDHADFDLGSIHLGFDRIKEDAKGGTGGPVIWFHVDNVEGVFMHLVSLGARVRSNINEDQQPGYAVAVLYDPDGNMVGIMGPSIPSRR